MQAVTTILLSGLIGTIAAGSALAAGGASLKGPPVSLHLLEGWQEPDGSRIVGVVFDLESGWKTYWRSPGEYGIPPEFDWRQSTNVQSAEPLWPVPSLLDSYGAVVVGYDRDLVLPVRLTPKDANAPMGIALEAKFGVCSDVCIPAQASVGATVSPQTTDNDLRLKLAVMDRPEDLAASAMTCELSMQAGKTGLTAYLDDLGETGGTPLYAVVEVPQRDVFIELPMVTASGDGAVVKTSIDYYGDGPFLLGRSDVSLSVFTDRGMVEAKGCTSP